MLSTPGYFWDQDYRYQGDAKWKIHYHNILANMTKNCLYFGKGENDVKECSFIWYCSRCWQTITDNFHWTDDLNFQNSNSYDICQICYANLTSEQQKNLISTINKIWPSCCHYTQIDVS